MNSPPPHPTPPQTRRSSCRGRSMCPWRRLPQGHCCADICCSLVCAPCVECQLLGETEKRGGIYGEWSESSARSRFEQPWKFGLFNCMDDLRTCEWHTFFYVHPSQNSKFLRRAPALVAGAMNVGFAEIREFCVVWGKVRPRCCRVRWMMASRKMKLLCGGVTASMLSVPFRPALFCGACVIFGCLPLSARPFRDTSCLPSSSHRCLSLYLVFYPPKITRFPCESISSKTS